MSKWLDPVIQSIPGMEIDWLYTSPSFGVTHWDCSHGQQALSDERCQYWYVISIVHDGAFVLHTEGRSAVIDSTSVLFYNPGAPYQSSHPFGCCDHGSTLVVRREALLDVMSHHDPTAEERPEALFTMTHGHGLARVYALQRLLFHRLSSGSPPDPLAIEAAALRIVGEVAAECVRMRGGRRPGRQPVTSRARRDYVADAQALMRARFREKIQLDDIACSLHVSTYHLCRLFKQETGLPMHRYLNRLRLREALEPLTAGRTDLAELALTLGFSSQSHFTNSFRKEFGVPPSEFRRAARG